MASWALSLLFSPYLWEDRLLTGNKLAKVGVEASEIKLEASEDQVEMATEQYYWQMVSVKEKLQTLGAIHQMLEELEKDVSNKVVCPECHTTVPPVGKECRGS